MGNNNSREKIIKEVVTDEIDNIEIPANAKQNTWEKIQANKQNSNLYNPRKSHFLKITVGVTVSVLIFFVLALSNTNNSGTAFFWHIKNFMQSKDETTKLTTETHLSIDDFNRDIDESVIFYDLEDVKLTIEEAEEITNFNVILPKYIPESYEFAYASAYISNRQNYKLNDIKLYYKNKDTNDQFTIRQLYFGEGNGLSMVVDHEDTKIEKIDIGNNEITLFTFKDDSTILWLELPHMKIVIESTLKAEELLDMSQSMIR